MLQFNRLAGSVGAGALVLMSAAAHAQEAAPSTSGPTFTFEGKGGAEYNSNVAVQELDANTGQSDWAATINARGEVSGSPVDKLTLRAGYEFSQSLHEEFDSFDITLHRGYGEASYDFSGVTAGVIANLAQANLAGDKYLTFTQVSPYLSRQFNDTLFLRVAYAASDKTFEGRSARDATSDAVSGDAYFFLNGTKQYIAVSGKALEEDANDSSLDYGAGSARVRYVQRFPAFDRDMTFRAGVEYEKRDYDAPTPSIGAPRSDKRAGVDLSLEAPITDNIFVEGSYRYGDYQSNLASADYNEQVTSVKLGVKY
jgi:opacity protein-like surface antigen